MSSATVIVSQGHDVSVTSIYFDIWHTEAVNLTVWTSFESLIQER